MTDKELLATWLRLHWDVPPTTSRKKEFWVKYLDAERE